MNKMKVCVIDPNATEEYTYGLLKELSELTKVTYITKKNMYKETDGILKIWKRDFALSNNLLVIAGIVNEQTNEALAK